MRRPFHTADVFTDRLFGGNPVAVFPDGSGLDAALMQAIAREMNLSETVFVLPPDSPRHTRRLRIFTPAAELPFAGHPTLGTAFVLAAIGEVPLRGETTDIVFEEGVGPVPVRIEAGEGRPVRMELEAAQPPEPGPPAPDLEAIAAAVGLDPEQILAGAEGPCAASCGVPFLFVALRDRTALATARLRRDAWERALADTWAPSLFLYTRDVGDSGADLRARMFAPGLGVEEDPATGSAVAALGHVLAAGDPRSDARIQVAVDQGVEMGRPSRLLLDVEKQAGRARTVRVAGEAVLVATGEMEIPDAY